MEVNLPGVKIVGKIQLSDEDLKKNRFKTGQSQYNHIAKVETVKSENIPQDTVDKLYEVLGKLENSRRSNEQIMDLRTILEFAFVLRLHPQVKFEPRKAKDIVNLHNAVEDYYSEYPEELSAKRLVDDIRRRLNHIIHNSIFLEVSEGELITLFHKVRCILDGLFLRNTSSEIVRTASFFDVNNEQKSAVDSQSLVTLVNAGPGTGKTHLIVDRLIKSAKEVSMEPTNRMVVGLAYTNEAAKQLKERFVYTIFGSDDYKGIDNVQISTIHSFVFNTLKAFYEHCGQTFGYEVIDESEEQDIIKDFNNDKRAVSHFLDENRLLTFNMILSMFDSVIHDDGRMKDYLVSSICEIILDEAQDASEITATLLKDIYDLAEGSIKIFLVGDQRQNIFAFNTGSLLNFSKVGFSPSEVTLHRCYRSPNPILEFVNQFMFTDCRNEGLYKQEHGTDDKFKKPECRGFFNEEAEISGIVEKIQELKNMTEVTYSDIAVLTQDSYAFSAFCKAFNAAGIPFRCFGGKTELLVPVRQCLYFLGAVESKDYCMKKLIAHLGISIDVQLSSEDDFIDYIETDISAGSMARLIKKYRSVIRGEGKYDIAEAIDEYAASVDSADLLRDLGNVVRSIGIESYKELKQKLSPSIPEMDEFFYKPNSVKSDNTSNDFVILSTIHSAKGKEWQYVFVPGLTDGKCPRYNKYATAGSELLAHENNELKKFYVACTRASKGLFLSWTRSYRNETYLFENRKMSKFLYRYKDQLNMF